MKVISSDGLEFEIDADVAVQSSMLKMFSDEGAEGPVPLPKVTASILKPVIDFCEHHKNDSQPEPIDEDDDPNADIDEPKREDDISEWDSTFINQFTVQDGTLFDIITAANYLGIKALLSVGCKTIANMVRGKTSSEIKEIFNISYPPDQSLNKPTTSGNDSEPVEAVVSNDTDAASHAESMNE